MPDLTLSSTMDAFLAQTTNAGQKTTILNSIGGMPGYPEYIKPQGINDISTPWVIAHRGCYNVAPEETMESYRISVDAGVKFIEPDVILLGDGTLAVMHDDTVNRTTTSTGNVTNFTNISWKQLNNDDGSRLVGWPLDLKCPTFDEFLAEFGNRVVIVPECKTQGIGDKVVAALIKHGIRKDMVIVQGSLLSDCVAVVNAGYQAMRMSSTNYSETLAAGIEYTGFGYTETANIAAATAAGLKVIVWTTKRNLESDSATAAGAIAFFSDDPVYQSNLHKIPTDQYKSKMVYHGDLRESPLTALNTIDTTDGSLYIKAQTLSVAQITQLLGWASPISNPSNYVLNFSIMFKAPEMNESRFASICIQTTDRAVVNDNVESGKSLYNIIFRRDGRIGIFNYDDVVAGPSTNSSASAIPADLIAQDTWVPFRITVTPTQIIAERVGYAVSVTHVNSTHRGAYLFAGAKAIDVKFKEMTISV